MNLNYLVRLKRKEIYTIATRYGAYNIRLFGSVARKDADDQSDIDFLVDLEKGKSLFDLGGLLMDLEELLGTNVDVVTKKKSTKRYSTTNSKGIHSFMREPKERLKHILEAIEKIEKYAFKGKIEFLENELIQNWIVHHLQINGEACYALPESFLQNKSHIPWKKIIGMRHILVHHYFEIDLEIVWNVIENDLTPFKLSILKLIQNEK
jgi:uncharacterized protein with HEPN domain